VPTIEYNSPGVYGIEVAPGRANEGISPAKMGVAGWTEQGPSNEPVEVRSVKEFTRIFGGMSQMGLTPISMRAFFGTGGQRAWVVRVVPADAVAALVDVDAGPVKWTFTSFGEGVWGNDTVIRIEGNRNFRDLTSSPPAYTKFDVKVLRPASFDPAFQVAEEVFEAVQFTDPLASDYLTAAMTDPRRPSRLVVLTEGAGGTPSGLIGADFTDEPVGVGAPPQTQYVYTLLNLPVVDGSVTLVAGGVDIDDEAQTVVPVPDAIATGFTGTLASAPALDGTLRMFYAKSPAVLNEAAPFVGLVNGANPDYTLAAGALSDSIHREGTVFRVRIPNLDAASGGAGNRGTTTGGGTFDLSAGTFPVTALGQPVHPGTILVTFVGTGDTVVDDGAGGVTGTGGLAALVGFIDYSTGLMWADAAFTVPLVATAQTPTTAVTATFDVSTFITKTAGTDNLELGVVLTTPGAFGAVLDGAGTNPNTVDLVDSVTTPTGAGAILISVTVAPATYGPGVLLVDFVASGIIESDVAGNLTGDVGIGTNTVDFVTGDFDVELAVAALTGETVDADYQTGQLVFDDGLGNLTGDVDAAGNNTINYTTGAIDVTFAAAPPLASAVLANYSQLPTFIEYPLAGGLDGTAVTRNDISNAALLEDDQLGLFALDRVEDPLNVILPDFEGSSNVQNDLVDYCEDRDTRFAILGFANGTTYQEAIQYNLVTQAWDTKVAAIYWPNIYFVNEETDRPELIPVTPFIAGVYAKTARNKNVGKAPGGIEDGLLDANGTVAPEFERQVNDVRVRDNLYQSRINPLFNSNATGFVVWGVRSLSNEPRWRYVQARLLHNFLFDAVRRQLLWAVFENNGPALWSKVENVLTAYFQTLYEAGFFAGTVEAQAYFVTCNVTNNNQATVDAGQLIIDIGFSPFKPAEFVIFTLQQPASTTTV